MRQGEREDRDQDMLAALHIGVRHGKCHHRGKISRRVRNARMEETGLDWWHNKTKTELILRHLYYLPLPGNHQDKANARTSTKMGTKRHFQKKCMHAWGG